MSPSHRSSSRHARRHRLLAAAVPVACIPLAQVRPAHAAFTNRYFDTSMTIEAGNTTLQYPVNTPPDKIVFGHVNTNLSLTVQNGGLVDAPEISFSGTAGLNETVILDGVGSSLHTPDDPTETYGNVYIGERGNASMTVRNGATVQTWRGWVGYFTGATGSLVIDGPGTRWTNDKNFYVGVNGDAVAYLQNQATLQTYAGRVAEGNGNTNTHSNATMYVTDSGTSYTCTNELTVARAAGCVGTLNINSGATVSTPNLTLGLCMASAFFGASDGTVNVTGPSTHLTGVTQFNIGEGGRGTVNVSNGAQVDGGLVRVAQWGDGAGTLSVDGPGTFLSAAGAYGDVLGPALDVGYWGPGTLNVTNGARVSSKNGSIGTGYGAGPTGVYTSGKVLAGVGVATVDGTGSVWHNDTTLTLGMGMVDPNNKTATPPAVRGDGTLNVTNGGLVENTSATLGNTTATVGRVYVSGAGSQWNSSGTVTVGSVNSGTITGGVGIVGVSAGGAISVTGAGTIGPNGSVTNAGGTLSFGTAASAANVTNNGSFTQTAGTLNLNSTATVGAQFINNGTADLGGNLQFGTGAVLSNSVGTTTLRSDPSPTGTPALTVNANSGVVNFAAPAIHLATLNIATGGVATVPANGARVLVTRALSITGAGKLDLVDNDAVVDYTGTSVYTTMRTLLALGRSSGNWSGPGITSTAAAATTATGIGLAEASDLLGLASSGTGSWDGQTVDGTSVLMKYTYCGDANLDGRIDADDYSLVDRYMAGHPAGGSNARWLDGDFDYSGTVTAADYLLMDSAFAHQAGVTLSAAFLTARAAQFGDTYVSELAAAVPEPTAAVNVTGALLFSVAVQRRRRRPGLTVQPAAPNRG